MRWDYKDTKKMLKKFTVSEKETFLLTDWSMRAGHTRQQRHQLLRETLQEISEPLRAHGGQVMFQKIRAMHRW